MAEGNEFVLRLLAERRQRLVGSIMSEAERHLFPHVPAANRAAYRDKVLEYVGAYHDVVLDCVKASVDDGTRNDPAEILRAIRSEVRTTMRAELSKGEHDGG